MTVYEIAQLISILLIFVALITTFIVGRRVRKNLEKKKEDEDKIEAGEQLLKEELEKKNLDDKQ